MSVIRGPRTRREYALFFLAWFVFVASGIGFYVYTSTHYGYITELAVCPSESAEPLAPPAVVQAQTPYVCGTLAGNARMYVSIDLYEASNLVAQTSAYLRLGRFSEPVARQPTLETGHYTVRIMTGGGQLMAETSFNVQSQ